MLQWYMQNINKLIFYLQDTLHLSIRIRNSKPDFTKSIPMAIKSNYDVFHISIQGVDMVLLSVDEENIRSIKKHLSLFENSLSAPVILHIEHISSSTKRYLIENGIPFISEQSIYLPQLLMHFDNLKEDYKKIKNKKLSKLAQTILISLIVKREHTINIIDSAKMFEVTKMSTSRALAELVDFKYLDVKQVGRKKEYFLKHRIDMDKLFLELKSPVVDVVYIKSEDLNYFDKKVEASFSALTRYANIINTKPIYAIEKACFDKIVKKDNQITVYDKEYDHSLIQIELWRYKTRLVDKDIADPISLYISLKDKVNMHDSRTHDAMDELYNKIEGMIS